MNSFAQCTALAEQPGVKIQEVTVGLMRTVLPSASWVIGGMWCYEILKPLCDSCP